MGQSGWNQNTALIDPEALLERVLSIKIIEG